MNIAQVFMRKREAELLLSKRVWGFEEGFLESHENFRFQKRIERQKKQNVVSDQK